MRVEFRLTIIPKADRLYTEIRTACADNPYFQARHPPRRQRAQTKISDKVRIALFEMPGHPKCLELTRLNINLLR